MRKGSLTVLFLVLVTFCGLVYANQEPEEILRAVIKIRAVIPENARTAEALGTEREGNGVVIDSDGHVLTIGYLILEAEKIEITGPDGEVMDAIFVGYDYNSGLGLLRANTSLNVQPMKLGQSSEVKVGDPVLDIRDIYQKFYTIRAAVSRINANNTHSGNLSMRNPEDPDCFYITATGCQCGALILRDIVPIHFSDVSWGDARGSTESTIHRKILKISGVNAVLHAHYIYDSTISFDLV